jgi:hypothetical protein
MEFRFDRIESPHYVQSTTPDGHAAYTLTGVAVVGVGGDGSSEWSRGKLNFYVPFPLPAGKNFRLINWAPFVTLNSISNDREAVDAGWAIDGFRLVRPDRLQGNLVQVEVDVATRDVDGYILRLGYHVSLVGEIQ